MDPVQVLSALGSLALIFGIGIGLLQLRALAKQRQEDMVLRAYAPFFDPAFSRAFWQIQSWKFATFEEFESQATLDDQVTLDVVTMQFEMMGLMLQRGLAKIDFLDDLVAESTLMTWNKVAPILYGYRIKTNTPGWSRWFETLAVALDQRLTELGEPHQALVRPVSLPARAAE